MAGSRSLSERRPAEAAVSDVAIRVGLLTERMGLVPPAAYRPDAHWLTELAGWLDARGIAQRTTPSLRSSSGLDRERLDHTLSQVLEALEESPSPTDEWEPLIATLGEELLCELLGTSPSSVRRYAIGERQTPDEVAARLHVLTLVVTDLAGAYNDYGVRRWFERPRTALDGLTPRQTLGTAFDPDAETTRSVRSLAANLVELGAT